MRRPSGLPASTPEPPKQRPEPLAPRMPPRDLPPFVEKASDAAKGTDAGRIIKLHTASDTEAKRDDAPVSTEGESSDTPESDAATPLTSRDVWRAARARRKALRAEIRRFTKTARRRRWMWLGSIGAVLALVAGSVIAAYSPLFALQRITVVGTSVLDAETVEAALAEQLGRPLGLIDQEEVERALAGFPMIETYALEGKPPHEVVVRIVERTPVGVVESGGTFFLVDAAGVELAAYPARPEGQPVMDVQGGTGSQAFVSAGLVVRSVPSEVRAQIVRVTASSPDDVTLRLSSGTTVVWGSAEDSALKAIVLDRTMQASPGARRYDVSSPEAVIVG